jgi:hypothetical protein
MQPELQEYYEETFGTTSSKGWKFLIEDMENLMDNINDLSSVSSTDDLFFRKGQLDILNLIVNRKKICEESYNNLVGGY